MKLTEVYGSPVEDRTYLTVPFDEKDEAKVMKVKWDPDKKLWYHAKGVTDDQALARWKQETKPKTTPKPEDDYNEDPPPF